MMTKVLIRSNYSGFNFYRLHGCEHDFAVETELDNGDCLCVKTNDNAKVTKWLEAFGGCVDQLHALAMINQSLPK